MTDNNLFMWLLFSMFAVTAGALINFAVMDLPGEDITPAQYYEQSLQYLEDIRDSVGACNQ